MALGIGLLKQAKRHGYTQKDLAAVMDISPRTVNRIITRTRAIKARELIQLRALLTVLKEK